MMMRDDLSAAIRHSADKKRVGIWPLLVWAFKRECARIDFDELGTETAQPSFGMEYVLMQQQILGCRPDGGGQSSPHHDADLVGSAVSTLPEGCGGRSMALFIADQARRDELPQWDVPTRIRPVGTQSNQHGVQAVTKCTSVLGEEPNEWVNGRGNFVKRYGRFCPVVIDGTASDKAAARRNYLAFIGALIELRTTFRMKQDLTAFRVSMDMPSRLPWKKDVDESCPPLS